MAVPQYVDPKRHGFSGLIDPARMVRRHHHHDAAEGLAGLRVQPRGERGTDQERGAKPGREAEWSHGHSLRSRTGSVRSRDDTAVSGWNRPGPDATRDRS